MKRNSFSNGTEKFASQEKGNREAPAAAASNAPASEPENENKKNYAMWVSILDSISQTDSLNAQIRATENQVKDLNVVKEKLDSQIKGLNGDKTQLGNRVNELADYNAKLEKEIHTLYDYNAKLEKQVRDLTDQKTSLENQVTSLSAKLANIYQSASYRIGRFIWPFGSGDK